MASRTPAPLPFREAAATLGILLVFLAVLTGGCLRTEPEELPPQVATPSAETTVIQTMTVAPRENTSSNLPVAISSPKHLIIFSELDFPPEVNEAVSNYAGGKTTDSIGGFLRWESVRARTNQSDAALIREQVRRIDYALFNTTAKENISVYTGTSVEQARRIRNDSVFAESGYIIASYDPSVVYHWFGNTGRDSEGYFTMCVIDLRRGTHVLLVNETERELLLPRDSIWDVAGEETYEKLDFSKDSSPRYREIILSKVRLIHTREHP